MRAFARLRSVYWRARHRRAALHCAALVALVVLATAGCDDNEASSGPSAATASPSVRQRVSSLLAPPDQSLQVIFRERTPYSKEPDYFVWTQGNGMRRWDSVLTDSGKAWFGEFSIETAFSPGAPLGDPNIGCGWYGDPDLAPGEVHLHCSWGSGWDLAAFLPMADAMHSYVADRLPGQTVAGRTAACYSFDYPSRYSVAVFCVDSEAGIPLLLTTVSPGDQFTRELEAIAVSTAEQNILVPAIEFEEDPLWGPQGEAVVPFSSLQLPDFSQFEE